MDDTVTAPIAKGQKLGVAKVMFGNNKIGEIDLIAAEGVEKLTFLKALSRVFRALTSL